MAAFPEIERPQYTAGGTPFEFLFNGYQEDFVVRASSSYMMARVAWDDAGDFLRDVLGSTAGNVSDPMYTRTLPLEHPGLTDCWCTDAKLVSTPSSSKGAANQYDEALDTGMFTADWAVYGLTFTRMPYFVVGDSTVSSQTIPELFRFCTISDRPRAREFTVNSNSLAEEGNLSNVLRTPAFVMAREQDLIITQYQIPAELFPYSAIDNCLGKINLSAIELPIAYLGSGSYVTRTYPAQSLLFRGIATDITMYPGPVGESGVLKWYKDLPMFFTYNPNTWRKLPNPAGDGAPITVVRLGIADAQNKYLYSTQEFAAMFKPST